MEREFERRRYVFRVDPLPVLSVDLQSRRRASRSAFFKRGRRLSQKRFLSLSRSSGCLGRLFLSEPDILQNVSAEKRGLRSQTSGLRSNEFSVILWPRFERGTASPTMWPRIGNSSWRITTSATTVAGFIPNFAKLFQAFKQAGGSNLIWEEGIPHREGAYTFTKTGDESRALLRLRARKKRSATKVSFAFQI